MKDFIKKIEVIEDASKKQLLRNLMDMISERRLKFSTYLTGHVASESLSKTDEAIAEAYLTGIDDANRIVLFLLGEGPDIKSPDFFKKAKVHKPSNYGVTNLPIEEQKQYIESLILYDEKSICIEHNIDNCKQCLIKALNA